MSFKQRTMFVSVESEGKLSFWDEPGDDRLPVTFVVSDFDITCGYPIMDEDVTPEQSALMEKIHNTLVEDT